MHFGTLQPASLVPPKKSKHRENRSNDFRNASIEPAFCSPGQPSFVIYSGEVELPPVAPGCPNRVTLAITGVHRQSIENGWFL